MVADLAHTWAHLSPGERRDALAILASHVALARDEEPAPAWRTVEELTLG